MLYDPRWGSQVKADPFSLDGLVQWLEQQPATAEYDYYDCQGSCLIGLYGAAVGVDWKELHRFFFNSRTEGRSILSIAAGRPRTFGGALKRARAMA